MFQQLCRRNERIQRSFARAVANVVSFMDTAAEMTMTTLTTAWNGIPSVHTTAICTHGKPYVRRLRELHT